MIDYRYFVTSVIAVFIALGLGVLLGGAVAGGFFTGQELEQFETPEEDVDLVAENAGLRDSVVYYTEFSRQLARPILANRLVGRRLSLIVTGQSAVPPELEAALDLAGAQIVARTAVADLTLEDAQVRSRVISFYGLSAEASADELRTQIGSSVGVMLGGRYSQNTVTFLQELGLLSFEGDYQSDIDGVVCFGGAAADEVRYWAETFDAGLLSALIRLQPNVVGAEYYGAAVSYMPLYQAYGIDTVDNADQASGQLALVLALDQAAGRFGRKDTAQQLIPAL
jgi:hypothetical protein